MKNLLSLAVITLLSLTLVQAQNPEPVLTKGDVERFVKSMKPMTDELEALDVELDYNEDMSMAEAISANSEAWAIIEKYGWGKDFATKWATIAMGYASLKIDEQLAQLPEAQRAQMKQMMSMAQKSLKPVHENDMKLINAQKSTLDKVLDEN